MDNVSTNGHNAKEKWGEMGTCRDVHQEGEIPEIKRISSPVSVSGEEVAVSTDAQHVQQNQQ
eukprot:7701617-Pyramimonas_sp.AAC.2